MEGSIVVVVFLVAQAVRTKHATNIKNPFFKILLKFIIAP